MVYMWHMLPGLDLMCHTYIYTVDDPACTAFHFRTAGYKDLIVLYLLLLVTVL